MPGLVDTHVHVNEPGRTEWEGFATATGRGRRRRRDHDPGHAAQLDPGHDDRAALAVKRAVGRRASASVDVGFWGGAVPEQPRPPRPSCTTPACSASSASCSTPACPSSRRCRPTSCSQAMAEIAAFDGLLIVHAEDPAIDRRAPGRITRPHYRGLPRLAAAGGREHRDRDGDRRRPRYRLPGPHRAPVQRRGAAGAGRGPGRGRPVYGGDLPALPDAAPPRTSPTGRPSSSAARRSARPPTPTCSGRRWPTG